LIPIIERKVVPDSIVYSDCWRGYDVLEVSDFHHFRINHSKLFADRHNHINHCPAVHVYMHERGHREFLEPGQAPYAPIQRCPQRPIWAIFEGLRVAF